MSADLKTATPILMPRIGHAMEEGTVVEWHRADGDTVSEGEVIVTVETDKANYDIESPASGPLQIIVQAGEEVPVETLIGAIGEGAPAAKPAKPPDPVAAPANAGPPSRPARVLASPRAKRLAAELGVDLAGVTASSADGVISAEDIWAAATPVASEAPSPAAPESTEQPPPAPSERVRERRKLTGMRKTAARRLTEAWRVPHIVQMVDVDASGLTAERARLKERGLNVSLNDLVLHAAANEMAERPDLNATVEGDDLLLYDSVDAGLAVDTPRGLVAPVVRDAGAMSLEELSAAMAGLIDAARAGRLPAESLGAASLTVSSLGAYGIRFGTPVINLGEPLLIFVGAIEERPAAHNGRVVLRPTLTLSIAYDHRVTDGLAAAEFSRGLKARLEAIAPAEAKQSPVQRAAANGLDSREVVASSEAGELLTTVRTRQGEISFDEPLDAGGKDSAPSPVEGLLASLAGCMVVSFKYFARRKGVQVDRVEAWAQANSSRYIERIVLEMEVWSPEDEAKVQAILPDAKRGCFVSAILRPDLDYQVDLLVRKPAADSDEQD